MRFVTISLVISLLPAGFFLLAAFATGSLWLIALASISGIMILFGFRRIPAQPPHIGVVTFWGKRQKHAIGEGLVLLLPYFPFLLDVILVDVEKKNNDFKLEDIRCRLKTEDEEKSGTTHVLQDESQAQSGGEVNADVSITWEPDNGDKSDKKLLGRLNEYINSGGKEGVETILRDMLAEDVRQLGERRTWEQMTFGKDRLSAILITKLTGKTPARLEVDAEGKVVLENKELKETGEHIQPEDATDREIRHFLNSALTNGASDIHDLGIRIRRLNVTRVEPQGALAEDAERPAREHQQRSAEEFETDTVVRIAAKYREEDDTIPWKDALKYARIERGKTKQIYIETDGGGSALPIVNLGNLGEQRQGE